MPATAFPRRSIATAFRMALLVWSVGSLEKSMSPYWPFSSRHCDSLFLAGCGTLWSGGNKVPAKWIFDRPTVQWSPSDPSGKQHLF